MSRVDLPATRRLIGPVWAAVVVVVVLAGVMGLGDLSGPTGSCAGGCVPPVSAAQPVAAPDEVDPSRTRAPSPLATAVAPSGDGTTLSGWPSSIPSTTPAPPLAPDVAPTATVEGVPEPPRRSVAPRPTAKPTPKPTSHPKPMPRPTPKPTTKPTTKPTPTARQKPTPKPTPVPRPAVDLVWDRLAACESGGNWAADPGTGYSGGLQLSTAEWQSFGGGAYATGPARGTRAQQIAVATRLRDARGGYGSWPRCAAQLGLSG